MKKRWFLGLMIIVFFFVTGCQWEDPRWRFPEKYFDTTVGRLIHISLFDEITQEIKQYRLILEKNILDIAANPLNMGKSMKCKFLARREQSPSRGQSPSKVEKELELRCTMQHKNMGELYYAEETWSYQNFREQTECGEMEIGVIVVVKFFDSPEKIDSFLSHFRKDEKDVPTIVVFNKEGNCEGGYINTHNIEGAAWINVIYCMMKDPSLMDSFKVSEGEVIFSCVIKELKSRYPAKSNSCKQVHYQASPPWKSKDMENTITNTLK